jgi:hypothetical protein
MAYSTGKPRTLAITILALLAAIAGILAVIDTLRLLGLMPTTVNTLLGELKFYNTNWLGAILAGIVAVIWFVVAWQLWNVDPRGWLFVVVIAVINIVFLLLAVLGQSTFQSVLLQLAINAVALILALLPSTKEAFNMKK